MLPGYLVSSDVQTLSSYVQVNGIVRGHESWSVDRELAGDLPAQVVAGSGIRQATGSIVWAEVPDVTARAVNPWNRGSGWLPGKGDRVIIWAGDGTTYWKVFTGVIDETTGAVGGLPQSSLIDDYDRLNVRFSHDALLRIMPPLNRGDAEYRGIGLSSLYFVDAALRKAGFYATPALEPRTIVSVPAQSSLWPESGRLAGGKVLSESWATRHAAPWGLSMGNFETSYDPSLSYPMSEKVQFTMMVAPDHGGNASFNAYYGPTDYVSLAVAGSRTVTARLNGVNVCSLVLGGATIVTLHIDGSTWTLRTNTGGMAVGTAAAPTTAVMRVLTMKADAASRVAGFQASHPSSTSAFQSVAHSPTAVYDVNFAHIGIMDASPAIKATTVIELLEQISRATLAAMWIDEAGVFRWTSSSVLRGRAPVQTVTTLDDVRSLAWSDALLGVRSSVNVDYRLPAVSRSRWDNVLWHQGGSETLESGQTSSSFVEPGADTDWIGLSPDFFKFGAAGSAAPSNNSWGSITGATLTDGTTEEAGSPYLSTSLVKVSPGTLKVTHTAGALPAGKKLELRYPSAATTVWPRWLKQAFPIIRGFAKVEWSDMTRTSTVAGPAWAPTLVHDAGPWNAREDETIIIDRLADFLASQVTTPQPTITGMSVGFDPRRQLGDVITISSPQLMGVTLTALIVEIGNSASGSYAQTLGLRIISAKSTFTTYDQLAEAWAGGNYASLQTAWAALNYNALEANPLEVTP